MKLVMLPLFDPGYIYVNPAFVKLVRLDANQSKDYHYIQLSDGLEYKLHGAPANTLVRWRNMANNISANPWYLDTASAAPVWTGKVYVKELIWNKPTAGDALIILDQNGNTILNTVANTNDPMFSFGTLSWVNGFVVTTLASGTLSVFITK